MEKVYVALLLLVAACLINENAASARRQEKMGPIWGQPPNPPQPVPHRGSGTVHVKGTAGGRLRQEKIDATSTASASAPVRPTAADCKVAGFFPSPGTCTEFYRCVDWTGAGSFFSIFHFNCPAGTVFDDALDVCNHGWAAGRPECGGAAAAAVSGPAVVAPVPSGPSQGTQTVSPVTGIAGSSGATIVEMTGQTSGFVGDSGSSTTRPTVPETSTTVAVLDTTTSGTPGVFSLTCYADNKYRRHPLYCNKYYYCIFDGDVWNVPSFTCPEGLVFDEANQICMRPGEKEANCQRAPYDKPRETVAPPTEAAPVTETTTQLTDPTTPQTVEPSTEAVTQPPVDTTTAKSWQVDPTSLFACPAPGYYPFEGDCVRFYKCVETDQSKLKGLLYRCPEGFGYSETRQRCLKNADLPTCQRVPQPQHFSLRYENATPIYPEDLLWFFKN